MPIILALIMCAILVCPIITLILFIYSLRELIADKSEINKTTQSGDFDDTERILIKTQGLREDIKKQRTRMIVTGVLGAVSWAIIVTTIIHIIRIMNGEISIM